MVSAGVQREGWLRFVLVPLCFLVGMGCGPEDSSEALSRTEEAVISGATNVTDPLASSIYESETASAVSGSSYVIAFNSYDTVHQQPGSYCSGFSYMGVAMATPAMGVFWHAYRIPVGSGVAIYYGDPSVTATDAGANVLVRISNLAVSTAHWNGIAGANGCAVKSTLPQNVIDQICEQDVLLPKSGGAAIPSAPVCFTLMGNSDSSLLARTGVGLYLATWNFQFNSIDVYTVSAPHFAGQPFPGKTMTGHPVAVKTTDGSFSIVAPDGNDQIWYTALDESTGNWSTPFLIGGAYTGLESNNVTLSNSTVLRQRGLDAAWGFFPTGQVLNVVYSSDVTGTTPGLVKYTCSASAATLISCSKTWDTGTAKTLLPSIVTATKVVSGRLSSVRTFVSYWQDVGGAAPLQLYYRQDFTAPTAVGGAQNPCPQTIHYWGDYDEMFVYNNFTASPMVNRPFTDSSDGACTTNSTTGEIVPQHVSDISWVSP